MKASNAFAQIFAVFAFLTLGSLMIIVSFHLLAFDDAILKIQEIIKVPGDPFRWGSLVSCLLCSALPLRRCL